MATGGRSLDSPRWCLYELASYLKDETVRDQRNIQILPVHLCFWTFHKVCWKSLSFSDFLGSYLFDGDVASAHFETSAPSNRFLTFWKVRTCQEIQWINGLQVCKLSPLHEFFVVVAACLVVVYPRPYRICWMLIWTRL